ncbi:MAG: PTS system mannose/fructose/sorbose family transporter subunit IID [Firmicutes bacterium]|nr:PTS system mannose/fructose/sorbose family transporter subunit IID [Candidatus Colivicinus equi]MDO4940061.1 PTS system mannose/fructose/sorbose family transporter subunit IID [Erysipelotrichaceae bacterium]
MAKNDIISAENNITVSDFKKTFWRSFTILGTYNYERMEALGFNYSIFPELEKIYKDDPEGLAQALARHMEVFNMTVAPSPFVMGIAIAMEEQYKRDPENFDVSSINAVKMSLMGPLSGIGDTFFWGIFRILAAAIGCSFASQGNLIAPFIFLILFNVPQFICRWYCLKIGYKNGNDFLVKMQQGGQMNLFTYCSGIVGVIAVACMIATQISLHCPLEFTISGTTIVLQEYIDQILPCLLPLTATLIVYYFLKKKTKVSHIMAGLIILGFICGVLGILG